jgi:dTMP kinase
VDARRHQEGRYELHHHAGLISTFVRGRLVVFEGGEGAGKSTQLQRLAARLTHAGVPHAVHREPGGTPVGDRIRELLLHSDVPLAPAAEAALFVASRAQLVAAVVKPALAAGQHILLDRFLLSTYAYQIHGRGLPSREVRAGNELATAGLAPDLTVLLRVPVNEGLSRADKRGAADRFERADRTFHNRVAAAFDSFAEVTWQRAHPECGPIVAVDAMGTPDEVEQRVLDALTTHCPALLERAGARA